jgi:hypothetical protein
MKSLDDRISDFLQQWATAALAQDRGQYAIAREGFLQAARIAPTCADETLALTRAHALLEQFEHGRRVDADDVDTEGSAPGYGHGV